MGTILMGIRCRIMQKTGSKEDRTLYWLYMSVYIRSLLILCAPLILRLSMTRYLLLFGEGIKPGILVLYLPEKLKR